MSNESAPLIDKSGGSAAAGVAASAAEQQSLLAGSNLLGGLGGPSTEANAAAMGRLNNGSHERSSISPPPPPPPSNQDASRAAPAPASFSYLPQYAGYGSVAGPSGNASSNANSNASSNAHSNANNNDHSNEQVPPYPMQAAQYDAAAAAANWGAAGSYPPPHAGNPNGAPGYAPHPQAMGMPMYPGVPHPMYASGQNGYPMSYQQPPQPFLMQMAGSPSMGYHMQHPQSQMHGRGNYSNANANVGANYVNVNANRPTSPTFMEPGTGIPTSMEQHARQEYPKQAASMEQLQQAMLMAAARTRSYSNDVDSTAPTPVKLRPSKTLPPPIVNPDIPIVPPTTIIATATSTSGGHSPKRTAHSPKAKGLKDFADIFSGGRASDAAGKHDGSSKHAPSGKVSSPLVPGGSSKPPKVRARLVRTNSSGDVDRPRSGKGRHRRASSDIPTFRSGSTFSGNALIPRAGNRKKPRGLSTDGVISSRGSVSGGNSIASNGSRSRAMSGSGLRMHRRVESAGNLSVLSTATSPGASIVSNIAKSAMFGGVDEETGMVQMHFPFESVRLFMINKDVVGDNIVGKIFIESTDEDSEIFANYQQVSYDLEMGEGVAHTPNWESMTDSHVPGKRTRHDNAHAHKAGIGKEDLLPNPQYAMSVDESVYRRVMHEISESQNMPCGLFFCGHHEDVAYPSIWIAVVIVGILFLTLAYVSIITSG